MIVMENYYIKTVLTSRATLSEVFLLGLVLEGSLQKFSNYYWILNSFHFSLVHCFDVDGGVLEPSDIVGH